MTRFAKGEWAERIKELRGELTQERFAQLLEMKQGTISSWESGELKYEPSKDTYFRLGIYAAELGRDPSWFWDQAGAPVKQLERVIGKMIVDKLEQRIAVAASSEKVAIPRENMAGKEVGLPIELPAELVPNPLSTRCLAVDKKVAVRDFAVGDLIVLDSSSTADHLASLIPFKDESVLLEFPSKEARARPFWWADWPEGLYLGVLRFRYSIGDPLVWWAKIGSLVGEEDEIPVGYWQHPGLAGLEQAARKAAREEARLQGPSELRLAQGIRVLGRVIGWFRPPVNGKKS